LGIQAEMTDFESVENDDSIPQEVSLAKPERSYNIFVLHPSHFLTDHRPHGDGLLAFQFLTRLAKRGHQVHVAVSMRSIQSDLPANLHLYDIKTRSAASIDGGSPVNRIEFSLRAGALFRQLSQTIRFDVAHQFNPVLYGLCFLANFGGTPLVMGPVPPTWPRGTVHPDSLKRHAIDVLKDPLQRFQYRWAARVLPASPVLLTKPPFSRLPAGKAEVLSYGIDTDFFTPEGPEHLPSKPTILFLANLWFGKGIFTLLDAFEHVYRAMPEARLVIAGKGTDEHKVRERINAHSARSGISMIGNVERERVPSVLRNCTVYCLPSFGEPFGMTALEAMSCGRATITTNIGGLAFLAPKEGTFQVSPGQPRALAEALLRVLADAQLASRMGKHNREHVLRHYAWDVILTQLETAYASVCAKKPNK